MLFLRNTGHDIGIIWLKNLAMLLYRAPQTVHMGSEVILKDWNIPGTQKMELWYELGKCQEFALPKVRKIWKN